MLTDLIAPAASDGFAGPGALDVRRSRYALPFPPAEPRPQQGSGAPFGGAQTAVGGGQTGVGSDQIRVAGRSMPGMGARLRPLAARWGVEGGAAGTVAVPGAVLRHPQFRTVLTTVIGTTLGNLSPGRPL